MHTLYSSVMNTLTLCYGLSQPETVWDKSTTVCDQERLRPRGPRAEPVWKCGQPREEEEVCTSIIRIMCTFIL